MTEKHLQDGMTNAFWIQAYSANVRFPPSLFELWTFQATMRVGRREDDGKARRQGQDMFCIVSSGVYGIARLCLLLSREACSHGCVHRFLRCSSTESRRPLGLAESLRFELAMYDISVHVFAPCTMYTPGYEVEMQTKPEITKKIEETDEGLSPEQAARAMLAGAHIVRISRVCADISRAGIQKGHAHFAGDLITNLFRVSTRGSAPNHNIFVDTVLQMIAWVGPRSFCRSSREVNANNLIARRTNMAVDYRGPNTKIQGRPFARNAEQRARRIDGKRDYRSFYYPLSSWVAHFALMFVTKICTRIAKSRTGICTT